jgi:hypothetical protein
MKTLRISVKAFIVLFIVTGIFYACKKENSLSSNIPAGQQKVSVFLADGPYDYQQVLIDIQQIQVKVDTCSHNGDTTFVHHPGCDDHHDSLDRSCEYWDTLDINPGVYDLLTLRNGIDTLLASGFVLNGKIERIKLVLGTNNSVMVDSVVHPLHLLNNMNSVFVDIHHDHLDSLSSNNFQLYLDFNLNRSIFYFMGQYWLSPVLMPYGLHSTGEIEGKIRPVHTYGTIYAYNATDTFYARPWWDQGEFKIRGLQPGTYNLFINGINGYADSTISNINVQRGRDTRLGTIQLHQ